MTELYWITRLPAINGALLFICIVSFIIALVCFFTWADDDFEDKNLKKWLIRTFIVFCTSLILYIFTPSEKQAYMIYGVGGTIDYLKSNETAKQLPDKCIQALDKVVDNYLKEEE